MYETIVNDLFLAFMQIPNYKLWLKGGSIGKDPDSTSLKLKVVVRCGDPKILIDAMKYFLGHKFLTLKIVPWRARRCLGPPNIS